MKKYFLFLFIVLLSSCVPDDLTQPVRVNFSVRLAEGEELPPFFTVDNVTLAIDQISFHGVREQGNDVVFSTRPDDSFGNYSLQNGSESAYITYFDLMQGVYQLMTWEIKLGEAVADNDKDDEVDFDDSGLIIEGTFKRRDDSSIKVFVAIDEDELLSVKMTGENHNDAIPLIADNVYHATLVISPHLLIRSLPLIMLEQAQLHEEEHEEYIEISKDENEELYNLVLFQLSKTLKAVISKE